MHGVKPVSNFMSHDLQIYSTGKTPAGSERGKLFNRRNRFFSAQIMIRSVLFVMNIVGFMPFYNRTKA